MLGGRPTVLPKMSKKPISAGEDLTAFATYMLSRLDSCDKVGISSRIVIVIIVTAFVDVGIIFRLGRFLL